MRYDESFRMSRVWDSHLRFIASTPGGFQTLHDEQKGEDSQYRSEGWMGNNGHEGLVMDRVSCIRDSCVSGVSAFTALWPLLDLTALDR